MARHHRVRIADLDAQIEKLFLDANDEPLELMAIADAINNDRLTFLGEKKMGRVRMLRKWSDRIEDRLDDIKNREFESIPFLGVF